MASAEATGRDTPLLADVALPVPLPREFTYRIPDALAADGGPRRGDLVIVPFGRRAEVVGLVVRAVRRGVGEGLAGGKLKDVLRTLPAEYSLAPDRLRLAEWLAAWYGLPLGEVVPLFHPPSPGTKARASRTGTTEFPLSDPKTVRLNAAQREARDAATRYLDDESFGCVLLHGVTGSGKTEVFLRVIAEALRRGRTAIYLLPEIALTPQTLARITARFGDEAAAVHSGMPAGRRCAVHEAAARGDVKVVVGPRSALFAPLADLGVVVVDEEHENSYKQEEKPRYHARQAALVRAREAAAVVMLGSATPDLASWHGAKRGRLDLVSLPDRAVGRMPEIEIADLRGHYSEDGFGPRLVECVEETLVAGRQAILYYNRRGFARVIQCRDCGEAVQCPHCDIGLTYHLRPRRLLCHYCGFTRPLPSVCPACRSENFLPAGGGTEKVELALSAAFPSARILRLDHDSTRRRGSHGRILSAFAGGEADILVGTQMVTKGHHFPDVDLVGVLAADDGLSLPDFRAAERSFQLLTQVAGRTGRRGAGRVIFQSWQPDDPVITAAAAHDYTGFVDRELRLRRTLGYPPFRRLLRIGLSSRQLGRGSDASEALARVLREGLSEGGREVLGPAPAVFARLQGRYRYMLLIKGTLAVAEKAWLADCLRSLKERFRGVEATLDIDPQGLF